MQAISGRARPDLAADLDAAPVGEPNVEDGHVGPGRRNPSQRLGRPSPPRRPRTKSSAASSSDRRPVRTISWSSRRKTLISTPVLTWSPIVVAS